MDPTGSDSSRVFDDLGEAVEISRTRAGDLVFEHLRSAIIRGDIQKGERLSEDEVAAAANLSRTPVREAFRRLEGEGLIKRLPRNGVEIVGLSVEDFMEIFEIRLLLEPGAASMAAERITTEELENLEALVNRLEHAIEAGDEEKMVECHTNWTVALSRSSGNKRLGDLLATYAEYVRKSSLTCLKVQGRDAIRTHRAITDAVRRRDAETAGNLTRQHLEYAIKTAAAGMGR